MAVAGLRGTSRRGLAVATWARSWNWTRLSRMRRQRRYQNAMTLGLVLLGPVLAVATILVLGPLDTGAGAQFNLRLVLLADLIYVLLLAALVLSRVGNLIAARRAKSAGSRLHLRLTGAFALMALLPTITVAVFAVLTINIGLETWFSERVRNVVGASLSAAEAYEQEHRDGLTQDAEALAAFLDANRRATFIMDDGELRQALSQGQAQIQRGLREAYVIDGTSEIRARGEGSYLFDFERPAADVIAEANEIGFALVQDWDNNELRALIPLRAFTDRYLYITREVDGQILNLLDDTQETARFYQQQENDRGRVLFDFALLYLGFAFLLILAAVWLGLWFAERLSRPVGRLTGAAQRVGAGDLDVKVQEEDGDDEIAMLGRYFNQMTRQLKGQRETLLDNTRQIERRQRLFDSVLTSVTSGVVGLDADGRVTFVNRSAERLLAWHENQRSVEITMAVPEFGPLFERLREQGIETAQEEIKVSRESRLENLLVRLSTRRREDGGLEGYVVAFDDVTDLVSAQRMAAWGDVARRIAHEIKNPLTPIQLSAERIRRKFRRQLGEEDAQSLEQLTEVIVRQTNDLRRIVDEFSKFARMPEPERKPEDIVDILRSVILLQEAGQPNVGFVTDLPTQGIPAEIDATMIGQAFTNLVKNAGEAIESYNETEPEQPVVPQVRVSCIVDEDMAVVRISDNGIGLPEDPSRLFEPYVTTREKGTGLGLPIVKKIIEEHGGTLTLERAEAFDDTGRHGAMAVIRLPVLTLLETESDINELEADAAPAETTFKM
ncbi:PAS domain-containing sensor histidine kinase [Marivita cryptomonadis]|uniref:histidine kinase n=2 Tax=Roseobacteraceae TaxID=2854170 RepID=A0A9Q2P9S8_9RHOB|nr:PAS domain-containing sensor histidine kinase [Marivita cryptomonadis]MBM2330502.1 PAS domain-containing sensor histidine kinase [Marivita cryptomonadis]MBM2340089.1 PAS domain-containing sensor histidine kinase [Marivita cryptomonadis]MBM2344750.1 PAS domain-containing sensor histidine kinase [Marivita cryptomonadis]MBM2349428.1 PAS domain-containing sensor histidine kinase [Marivita cryptomonadis]